MIREFTFNTGVRVENNRLGPTGGRLAPNGVWTIPFTCDDVPDGATFVFASDSAPVDAGHIRREIQPGSGLLSRYAYFRLPVQVTR